MCTRAALPQRRTVSGYAPHMSPSWPPWTPPHDLEDVRAGLLALVEAAINHDEVPSGETRRLLGEWLLWKWTESAGNPGKYDLRYASPAAADRLPAKGRSGLRHEHVFPRHLLADEILAQPHKAASLLRNKGVACVVTAEERKAVKASSKRGWQRFAGAEVEVIDRLTGDPLDFSDPAYGGPGHIYAELSGPAKLIHAPRHVRLVHGDGTVRRARLSVDADRYTLAWSHGQVWVDTTPDRYPHEVLAELASLLPAGTRLPVCGTCPRVVFSGMALGMGGGSVGYCTLAGEFDTGHLVELAAPGCNHHPAWPRPEPMITGTPAAEADEPQRGSQEPQDAALAVRGGTAELHVRDQQPWTLRSPRGRRRLAPVEGQALLGLIRACPQPEDRTCACRAHKLMREPTPTAGLFHAAGPPTLRLTGRGR